MAALGGRVPETTKVKTAAENVASMDEDAAVEI